MSRCAICSQTFETTAKTGRPKDYCSIACRRMAEREIKRLEKRIAELEEDLMRYRCFDPSTMLSSGKVSEVIVRYEAELKNQNDRFRLLLSGGEDNQQR